MCTKTSVQLSPINIISGEVCWLDNSYNCSPTRSDVSEDYLNIFTSGRSSAESDLEDRDIFITSDLNRIIKIIDDEKGLYIF